MRAEKRNPEDSTVEMPCIRRCALDEKDICQGCFRSMDEIMQWAGADKILRAEIFARAQCRRQQAPPPKFWRRWLK